MNDLQRIMLLVSMGTIALILCLPACTDAQPLGMFQFGYEDYLDPSLAAQDDQNMGNMSRKQLLRRLSKMTMSRSGSGPGYTMPRKRQSSDDTPRFRLFPLDRVVLTLQDMERGAYIDRMQENEKAMETAGRRR